jgi:predicted lysophospholipase L1 biosynthesis ABC-type transport system permease subunit
VCVAAPRTGPPAPPAIVAAESQPSAPARSTGAVASGTYAVVAPYDGTARVFGPLTALGTLLVAGCAVAVLLTATVEARQERAVTIAALRRLGAPAMALRTAALLRTVALLALFAPLTLLIADLAARPLVR